MQSTPLALGAGFANLPSTLLGGGRTTFATGRALVPCVNVVQVCDVLATRAVPAAIHPPKRLECLAGFGDAPGTADHPCLLSRVSTCPIEVDETNGRGFVGSTVGSCGCTFDLYGLHTAQDTFFEPLPQSPSPVWRAKEQTPVGG